LRPYERSVFYGRIGYLPFLELTAMVIRPDHYSGGIGDRSGHIKLRFVVRGPFLAGPCGRRPGFFCDR
jgi:hypothetical protein